MRVCVGRGKRKGPRTARKGEREQYIRGVEKRARKWDSSNNVK